MKLLIPLGLLVIAGCGSSDDTVNVPASATQGGNVIKDDALKAKIGGPTRPGGGGSPAAPQGVPK